MLVKALDEVVADGVIQQVVSYELGDYCFKSTDIGGNVVGWTLAHFGKCHQRTLLSSLKPKLLQECRLECGPICKGIGCMRAIPLISRAL